MSFKLVSQLPITKTTKSLDNHFDQLNMNNIFEAENF